LGSTILSTEVRERFSSMQQAFLKMDTNRDGRITANEIRSMCRQWNIPQGEADRVLAVADLDANGTLDFQEFAKRFNPDSAAVHIDSSSPSRRHNAYDDRPVGGAGHFTTEYDKQSNDYTGDHEGAATRIQAVHRGNQARGVVSEKRGSKTKSRNSPQQSSGDPVQVFGRDNCSRTRTVWACLEDAGIRFERRDIDKDKSYEAALEKSGFQEGKFRLPVVVVGGKALWDFDVNGLPALLRDAGVGGHAHRVLKVYGSADCSRTTQVCRGLETAGVPFEKHDANKDESFEAALFASGFTGGKFSLPVITYGMKAWWGKGPTELIAEALSAVKQDGGDGDEGHGASTPAGSGSRAAKAMRSTGDGGGGGSGKSPSKGDGCPNCAKLQARIDELERQLASKGSGSGSPHKAHTNGSSGGGGGGGGGRAAELERALAASEAREAALADQIARTIDPAEMEEEKMELLVYARNNCDKSKAMQKELTKAGIPFETRDFDKDKGYMQPLTESGCSSKGNVRPPVVCFGPQAWWDEPDADVATYFPGMVVNSLRKAGFGPKVAAAVVPVKDVTMDTEIAERFSSMQEAFLKVDDNKDGRVSVKELKEMCRKWNIPEREAERVLGEGDMNQNGTLDFREFARRFSGGFPTRKDTGYRNR